ncbi:MAG: MFS transporter [Oscillospiraceae bacterium]|jgi:GPH family glycoside/pentoside/hexuronide:cation symporter|nr:MFS transporter [Oscillospiraceae bacterium]
MKTGRLSWSTKIGYGLCTCAEAIPYNLLTIYFVFFLTDIVGIRPFLAGIVLFVVIMWDAVIDPFIGGLSDEHVTEKGRRLPWMKASVLPLAVAIFLMFSPFSIENMIGQSIYYVAVAILVCTTYSTFVIPYFAMGGEITADYGERNVLRFLSMLFYYPIFLLAASGPMLIWEWAESRGYSDRQAWGFTGVIFGVLLLVVSCIGLYMVRNSEKESIKTALEARKEKIKQSYIKIWRDCIRIKSFRKIVIWIFIYMLSFSIINTVVVYFMTYNVGMSESQQALFWVVYVAATVIILPVVTKYCNKVGKKPVLLITMIPSVVMGIILFFTGINSVAVMYVYAILIVLSSSTFFTFYLACAYDCVEIDEFLSGQRRDGSITSLACFAQQVGAALALPFTGMFLEFTGYDGMAEVQTTSALQGILTLATIFPAILLIIAIFFLAAYPVTKKKYELLCIALEKKKNNEEYYTKGFENIL